MPVQQPATLQKRALVTVARLSALREIKAVIPRTTCALHPKLFKEPVILVTLCSVMWRDRLSAGLILIALSDTANDSLHRSGLHDRKIVSIALLHSLLVVGALHVLIVIYSPTSAAPTRHDPLRGTVPAVLLPEASCRPQMTEMSTWCGFFISLINENIPFSPRSFRSNER